MVTGEPSPHGGSVGRMPMIDYVARLVPVDEVDPTVRLPDAWSITHPLGRPAGGTYTEVTFADEALADLVHADRAEVAAVCEEVVRRVAADLYGTAWAFTYRPEQFDDAIARHHMRRRELVIVTDLNVYTDPAPPPPPSTYGIRPHRYPRTRAEADVMRRMAESLLPKLPPDLADTDREGTQP